MAMRQGTFWWLVIAVLLGWKPAAGQDSSGMEDSAGQIENRVQVTGVVTGPDGPAEGVRVMLEVSDMRIRRQVAWLETRTDSAGTFRLDLSEIRPTDIPVFGLQFNTVSPRFVETLKIVELARSDLPGYVELEVRPGAIARGTVKDAEGNPLGGVRVSAPQVRPQTSTEEGEWESFGLIPGSTTLTFAKEGYAEETLAVRTSGPELVEGLEVVLTSARQLSGTIRNWADDAVPHALVTFQMPRRYQQVTANEKGEYLVKGVPEEVKGTYLEVMAEGYLPTTHYLTKEEAEEQKADLVLDEGVEVGGVVLLPSGEPAAGAVIIAGKAYSKRAPQCTASSDGSWKLSPFPPGKKVLFTALPPSPESSWGVADVEFQPPGKDGKSLGKVDLWPKGFSSTFSAVTTSGEVTLTRKDSGEGGFGTEVRYSAGWDGSSEVIEGWLEVVGLEQTGTFTIKRRFTSGQGLAGEWELREEIGPSALRVAPVQKQFEMAMLTGRMRLDFQLEAARSLNGQVLGEEGKPFIDGKVQLLGWNGTNVFDRETEIGIAGRFEFDRLPDGAFHVVAVSGDGEHQTAPRIARAGLENFILREGEAEPDPLDE